MEIIKSFSQISFVLFTVLTIISFVVSYRFYRKALKYTELENEEKAMKNGLLYLLFSKYTDLFLRISFILLIVNMVLIFF